MIIFLLNLCLIIADSSGAVPFGRIPQSFEMQRSHFAGVTGTMLLLVVLWFGISAPLSAIGAYFGSNHGVHFSRTFIRY